METLFLAFAVPDTLAEALRPVYQHYASVMAAPQPREKLHVTLVWLGSGDVPGYLLKKITKPLPQSFVPTVRLTHIGRGRVRDQLWAYAEAAGPLLTVREQLLSHLRDIKWPLPKQSVRRPFIPHVRVASLYPQVSHIGIADYPFVTSFAVHEVRLYKSTPVAAQPSVYSLVEPIPLV